jgi:hypothetical protein
MNVLADESLSRTLCRLERAKEVSHTRVSDHQNPSRPNALSHRANLLAGPVSEFNTRWKLEAEAFYSKPSMSVQQS